MRGSPLALLAVLGVACAPSVVLKTHPRAAPKVAHAVAVYPFVVRSDPSAEHAVVRGTRLAERVAATDLYAVFGPSDFQVRDPNRDAVLVLTDLATVVPAAGVPIEGLIVLRGSLERRTQSVTHPSGDGAGADQVTSVGHLELLEAASGEVIAEVESTTAGDVPVDTEIGKLADRMLEALPKLAPGERVSRPAWWASVEAVEGGLRVQQVSGQASAAGLRDGDLVTEVGSAAAGNLTLARARRLATEGERVAVTVRRAEGAVGLSLPVGNGS
jgi:hypothetical protein